MNGAFELICCPDCHKEGILSHPACRDRLLDSYSRSFTLLCLLGRHKRTGEGLDSLGPPSLQIVVTAHRQVILEDSYGIFICWFSRLGLSINEEPEFQRPAAQLQ